MPWPCHISCALSSSPHSPIRAKFHPLGNQNVALQCENAEETPPEKQKANPALKGGVGTKPGWDRPAGTQFQRLLLPWGCSGSQWLWETEGSGFGEERLSAPSTTGSFLLPSPCCLFFQVSMCWGRFPSHTLGLEGFTGGSGIWLTSAHQDTFPGMPQGACSKPAPAPHSLGDPRPELQGAAAGVGSSSGCCGSSLWNEEGSPGRVQHRRTPPPAPQPSGGSGCPAKNPSSC